jgi:hypothetical protein
VDSLALYHRGEQDVGHEEHHQNCRCQPVV